MKIEKSLEEVWEWKEKIYWENRGLPLEEVVKKIKDNATRINQRYGLNLEILDTRKSYQHEVKVEV
jgi:hypothetical protein